MTRGGVAVALAGTLLLAACSLDDPVPAPRPCAPPTGRTPDFVLPGADGGTIDLADLRCDQVMLLDFWASWCGPCRTVLPVLQELHETYGDRGLAIVAVNIGEDPDVVRAFLEANGYTFPVALDTAGAVADVYGADSIPLEVIIDAAGRIRCRGIGSSTLENCDYETLIPTLLDERSP